MSIMPRKIREVDQGVSENNRLLAMIGAQQISHQLAAGTNGNGISRSLIGTAGADKLKVRGRALTNKWKTMQIYLISKEQLLDSLTSPSTGLTPTEEMLVRGLWEDIDQPGWMDISRIRKLIGLSQDKARNLRGDFVSRGFAKKFPDKSNAFTC